MLKKLFAGLTVFTLAILVGVTVSRAYDYTDITYDELVSSVAGQSTTPSGIWFKSDGLVMYVLNMANDTVYQYDLATAWDPSTATLDASNTLSGAGTPFDLVFSDDGSNLYIIDVIGDDVQEYELDTPWDVSTITPTFSDVSNAARDGNSVAFRFGNEGSKLYILGSSTDTIYQYTLATPWEPGTATYDTVSFSVTNESANPLAIEFSSSGEELLIFDSSDTIYQYTLATPWDISTATYSELSVSIAGTSTGSDTIFLSTDELKLFALDSTSDSVYRFSVAEVVVTPPTPTSPNPPSAFTFGIADTGTCTWDPNIYLSVKGSNLAQVIVSDNLRFVGAQVLPYTPNNGSTVLPDHLSPVDNTMYIAFKLPSYATGVDPATGQQIAIPLYGPYSVYAVGRSGSGNITSIQTDSITFSSSEDCTYPYEVILEDDTGNGSEEGNEGTTPEDQDPLIPVERHQIISLSANMNDLTNEFYLVDTAADGSLVKRPDPRVTNYDISFSWLNKGYSFLSVNQRTLDSLPTAHAMLPEGPAILKFTEGSQNYFYIPSDNSAPREITTPNLANELFLGTPWQSSVWILGPEVPSSSVPHGRTIPRYDVAIVRDWRNNR